VTTGWTTRCCSALALIVASSTPIAAQSSQATNDGASLALFPIQSVWTMLDHPLIVPPAYDSVQMYLATDEGRLVAYDLARGIKVWDVAARPQHELAAGDGLLFIVEHDLLTARRASDGGVAWQVPFTEALASPPAGGNGRLAVATSAGAIVLIRASDGQVAWRRDLPSPVHSRLSLTADRVYVPSDNGHVLALRADTGDTMWDRRLGGPATDMLAIDARIYVGSTDNFLYCLNARDGRVLWRWRTGADIIGVPVVDDRHVYFVSLDNVLRALSRTTGVQQWFRPLSMRPTAGPVKAGATLIVPGLAPTIPAYDTKDGAPAGGVPAGDGETAALVHLVSGGTHESPAVVIVTRDAKGVTATLVTRQH
jgi:outer membrane protein assembly factor BamB